jgi:4-hydroxybenzoate polyprenyltransferase
MRSVNASPSAAIAAPAPPTTAAFWRGYWLTLRPYLFFVSGASGLLGLALAPGLGRVALLAAFAAFFFSYGLGQAVTDVFQTDTDAISSPYRPLVRGEIARAPVLLISLMGLGLCAVVMAVLNPLTLALSALAVAGLLTYTSFKRRWWAGPFWNSWIVALLPAIGFLCSGVALGPALASRTLQAAMLSVFFSYAVFVLLGYFKDISADRATGYRTLPVVAGWRVSVATSALFALAATAAGIWLLVQIGIPAAGIRPAAGAGLVFWLVGVLLLARAHVLMLRMRGEEEAHRAIAPAVRGHVLLHLGLAAAVRPELLLPVLGVYALFETALAARPETTQI